MLHRLAIVALVAVLGVASAVTTTSVVSAADTTIDNYGGQSGSTSTFLLYRQTRIPMMKFEFPDVPSDAYILSATLNMTFETYYTDLGGPLDLKVFKFIIQDVWTDFNENADWTYSGITNWAAPGMQDGVDKNTNLNKDFNLNIFIGNWTAIDVRDSVQKSVEAGRTWSAFMFSSYSYSGTLFARESAHPPTLTLTWAQGVPRASLPTIAIKNSDEWSPGGTITLSSSDSVIPQGTTPVYTWSILDAPSGSSHVEGESIGSDSTLTLTADVAGFYHLKVRIAKSDDLEAYSEAETYVQVGIKTERPRVHISREYVQTSIKNANFSEPPWSTMKATADSNGYWYFAYEDVYTYFLLWQATGDNTWCQRAWDLSIKSTIFINGQDPTGGYVSLKDKYPGDPHQAAFKGGQFIGNFAVAVDWGYDCLSYDQKSQIIYWVHQETEALTTNGYYETYLRNDGIIILQSIARAFVGLYGDDPEAARLGELYIKGWQKLRHGWSKVGKGGGTGEGNGYGHSTANYLVLGAHAIWTATGEDVYEDFDFFRTKLMYDAFALWPRQFGLPNDPYPNIPRGYPHWEMSGIGGDGRRSDGWITIAIRPVGRGLLSRYHDTEEGRAFMYLVRPVPAEWDMHEVIYTIKQDPNPPVPSRLSYHAEGMGYVYVRSDWTPDTTWFAFWAGPHVDLHQHLDQGAFNIYKRRDLAIKSGSYDGGNPTKDHSIAYYTRTISANGILIIDPQEQFSTFISGIGCSDDGQGSGTTYLMFNGLCPPNEGGQRTTAPLPMTVANVQDWDDNFYIYDTAKITSYYDFEGIVSIASDLTNSYNNPIYSSTYNKPKVTEVLRKTLYIRELDIFLIGDVVTATNPSFQKKTLLHALQTIEIDTDANTVIENERKGIDRYRNVKSGKIIMDDSEPSNPGQITYDLRWGNSTLLFETVFPEKFTYRLVGGRTPAEGSIADFWVDDYYYSSTAKQPRGAANYPVQESIEDNTVVFAPTYHGGYGRYRVEVEAEPGQATDYFLNIYRPTVDGINNEIPSYTKFSDDQFFGVVFNVNGKEYKAKFPKNGDAPFVGDAPPNVPLSVPPGSKTPGHKPSISAASGAVVFVAQLIACVALLVLA